MALTFGADDRGRDLGIGRGARRPAPRADRGIRRNIEAAGFEAVERGGRTAAAAE